MRVNHNTKQVFVVDCKANVIPATLTNNQKKYILNLTKNGKYLWVDDPNLNIYEQNQKGVKTLPDAFKRLATPCAYILEARDKAGRYKGIKVGSAANFTQRMQGLKLPKTAQQQQIAELRPIAVIPATKEKSKEAARYDAYTLENILHKFFLRHSQRIGNDYFIGYENNIFMIQDLLANEDTMNELKRYCLAPRKALFEAIQVCRKSYGKEVKEII